MSDQITNPNQRQVNYVLVSGLLADLIAVPVIVTLVFNHRHPVRWGDILASVGLMLVSVTYLTILIAIRRRNLNVAMHANVGFAVVCAALAAGGFAELASDSRLGLYKPVLVVGVVFVCIIGDRWARAAIVTYATAVVAWTSAVEHLRGRDLATVIIIYGATFTIVAWITARAVRSFVRIAGSQQGMQALTTALNDAETVEDAFRVGLAHVDDILGTDRVVVYAREADTGAFDVVASWPDEMPVLDHPRSEQLEAARAANAPVVDAVSCSVPVGYSEQGELLMTVWQIGTASWKRSRSGLSVPESANFLQSSFLKVTSRIAFVAGLRLEGRTDSLTGLANRRSLEERIEHEMARSVRSGTPLSLAMVDLDRFKIYNDHHGHVAGDTVLRSIAALMVSNLRASDVASRYGGEEFCLLFPETDLAGAVTVLESLRAARQHVGAPSEVTFSAGATVWDGFEDMASLVDRADRALYRAKELGRDRVVGFDAMSEV